MLYDSQLTSHEHLRIGGLRSSAEEIPLSVVDLLCLLKFSISASMILKTRVSFIIE